MKLVCMEGDHVQLVHEWLEDPENHKWLDFGAGLQKLSLTHVKLLEQRPQHCMRVFTDDEHERPIGIVCLSDLSAFGNANLWYVLGDKTCGRKNYTSRAVEEMLAIGFGPLNLRCITAWAVATNVASVRVLEKNGFRRAGVLREVHLIDGKAEDRVLFDLVASEFTSEVGVGVREASGAEARD